MNLKSIGSILALLMALVIPAAFAAEGRDAPASRDAEESPETTHLRQKRWVNGPEVGSDENLKFNTLVWKAVACYDFLKRHPEVEQARILFSKTYESFLGTFSSYQGRRLYSFEAAEIVDNFLRYIYPKWKNHFKPSDDMISLLMIRAENPENQSERQLFAAYCDDEPSPTPYEDEKSSWFKMSAAQRYNYVKGVILKAYDQAIQQGKNNVNKAVNIKSLMDKTLETIPYISNYRGKSIKIALESVLLWNESFIQLIKEWNEFLEDRNPQRYKTMKDSRYPEAHYTGSVIHKGRDEYFRRFMAGHFESSIEKGEEPIIFQQQPDFNRITALRNFNDGWEWNNSEWGWCSKKELISLPSLCNRVLLGIGHFLNTIEKHVWGPHELTLKCNVNTFYGELIRQFSSNDGYLSCLEELPEQVVYLLSKDLQDFYFDTRVVSEFESIYLLSYEYEKGWGKKEKQVIKTRSNETILNIVGDYISN